MKFIILIVLSALIGTGSGYGIFEFIKSTKTAQTAQPSQTEQVTSQSTDVKAVANGDEIIDDKDALSFKVFYEPDSLTRESAKVFIEMRARMHDLTDSKIEKMLKSFDALSSKMSVIDAFKIISIQNSLVEFADFKEPKLHGL